uniref:Gag-Pol polyprotein n=1 Tax=Tanacetum cinerariifolium TaxID=118510 RepID=A0A6L2MJL9_TANCI|nr:Gag-Pol polyprotein [Tanacetum cinerariifolium]
MADLAFAPQHNMIAYQKKTKNNAEIHKIVDFLTSSSIHHSLTTQSKATLNEPTPQGEVSGSGLECQETMRGAMAHIRSEGLIQSLDLPFSTSYVVGSGEDRMEHDIELTDLVPQTPHDSPLLGGHTPESDKGSMTLKELMDLCTTLLQKVLDLENIKTAQAKEIASLKKRVTKQDEFLKSLEQRQSSTISDFHPFRAGTSKRHSLGKRKVSKQERKNLKSQQMFQDIDDVLYEDADIEMIVKDKSNATLFDDEDVTIADTLVKMKNQKAKEKGIAFKDVDDSARPIRSITSLQSIPTIDPKDKEASKDALAEMYDEVQAQIDVDHELAVILTNKEQEKYIVKERSKQLAKERTEAIRRSKKDEKRIGSRKKRAAGSSSKHKSPKKQKVNNQEYEDSDKEHKKCLKMVPDDDKAIDYETLDVKYLIVDCESQVLATSEAGDVHVYKLTRLDGSYRHFLTFFRMLEVLDRQDVLDLCKIIMERFPGNDLEGYDLILWGNLKTLVESSKDDEIWRNQQDRKLLSWKLYETYGVNTLMLDDSLVSINMFVEKSDFVDTPLVEKSKQDKDLQGKPVDATLYRDMIGSLMYLTSSRPDLTYVVCLCAWYQAKPTEKHLNVVKRVFRYLKGTINMGLGYSKDTDSQMHNNILAAGSRDRPPMLAPGRYPQWHLRFLRYVNTRPNGEALRKCNLSSPYKPTTVLVHAVEATDDSPAVPEHTTETVERLQKGESLNIQDVKTNLFWEFSKFTSYDGESMESYYTRFYKLMNEMIINNLTVTTMQVNVKFFQQLQPEWSRFVTIVKQQHKLDEVSYHKLFDILKQYQNEVNELRAEKLARNANPLALVATAQAT